MNPRAWILSFLVAGSLNCTPEPTATSTDAPLVDQDGDGLPDTTEVQLGTNPPGLGH